MNSKKNLPVDSHATSDGCAELYTDALKRWIDRNKKGILIPFIYERMYNPDSECYSTILTGSKIDGIVSRKEQYEDGIGEDVVDEGKRAAKVKTAIGKDLREFTRLAKGCPLPDFQDLCIISNQRPNQILNLTDKPPITEIQVVISEEEIKSIMENYLSFLPSKESSREFVCSLVPAYGITVVATIDRKGSMSSPSGVMQWKEDKPHVSYRIVYPLSMARDLDDWRSGAYETFPSYDKMLGGLDRYLQLACMENPLSEVLGAAGGSLKIELSLFEKRMQKKYQEYDPYQHFEDEDIEPPKSSFALASVLGKGSDNRKLKR